MDRAELAHFVRYRREALRPADIGLPAEGSRRTPGLRREEVARQAGVSLDYYQRLEQGRTVPLSANVIADVARALRLTLEEFGYLSRLAGLPSPPRNSRFVEPGLLYLLDNLTAAPAFVLDDILTVAAHNSLAEAIFGRRTRLPGCQSNLAWQWFSRPALRNICMPEDRERISRMCVTELRAAAAWRTDDTTTRLIADLMRMSPDFVEYWSAPVPVTRLASHRLAIEHPLLGQLDVNCEVVLSTASGHNLLILRPEPGTGTAQQFDLLRQNLCADEFAG